MNDGDNEEVMVIMMNCEALGARNSLAITTQL